jgi:O-antigen/teichoic acid export membrane protein
MDLIFVGVVLILLVIMLFTRQVSSYAAITMLGTGYLVSAYVGHCNRNESYKPDWDSIKDVAAQSWIYARWSLVGVTSGLLQHRGYLYVITFALGLGTLGDTSAAHLLMMPVGFLVQSSGKISLAKAAEILAKSGIKKLKLFSISLASALFFCCLIYTLLLFFFFKPIAGILGSKYQNVGGYVWIWAIYFAANCIRYPLSNSLLACSQFRSIAIFDVISGVITITACIILTKYFYGYGAIWAVAGGEIILCLLTTKLLLTYKIENKIT